MKIYIFNADLYCAPCGEAIAATLPEPTEWEREYPDSNSYPIAHDSSEGQSDTPDHCGNCELFLERSLTDDGMEYVRDAVTELKFGMFLSSIFGPEEGTKGRNEIVEQWAEFYDISM